MATVDWAEHYREGAERMVREGDFLETIRLLTMASAAPHAKGNS
jgi:hypothetical protein